MKIYSLLKMNLLVLFLSISSANLAQKSETPDFKYDIGGTIDKMTLTQAGILLANHSNGLAGIKPGEENLVFNFKDFGKIKQEELEIVPNSPYAILSQGGSGLSVFTKKAVIDFITGKIIFETKTSGWNNATAVNVFLPENKLVVSGARNSKEKYAPAIGIYDMATGKEDKIIYLIKPGKVTMGTVAVSGTPLLLNESILVPTTKEIINFNMTTGDVTWRAKIDDIQWMTSDKTGKDIYAFEGTRGNTRINKISSSGTVLWKDAQKVKGSVTRFEILPQGIAIVSDVVNTGKKSILSKREESKIAFLSAKNGEDLWEKAPKTKGYVQHFYTLEDGFLFGIQSGGINKIGFDGKPLFRKPLKTGENIHTMALTPSGMLYITDTDANIINLKNGESIWSKPIKYKNAVNVASTYDAGNKRYLISNGKEVIAIDENSGDKSTLTTIKFKEKEAPSKMEVRNDGIFLGSDQNMMLMSFDGSEKYQEYYKSPGRSTFGKIMAGVAGVAATGLAMASAARAGANMQGNSLTTYNKYGEEANRSADMFSDIGSASFDYMSTRFKSTAATKDSQFILSKLSGGIGLLKLSKDSGKVEKEIILKNKKPEYKVDELGGILYYQADKKTIYAYSI
jgi:hypothetical protein